MPDQLSTLEALQNENAALRERMAELAPAQPNDARHDAPAVELDPLADALTAHLCVLDETGVILAVNRAWRDFGQANGLTTPHHALGVNYLAVCDATTGEDAPLARQFAAGIRAVLNGTRADYLLEYPCHSPTEQRWFLGKVARFVAARQTRVVITHETITDRRRMEDVLRQSEAKYRQLFENMQEGFSLQEIVTDDTGHVIDLRYLEVNAVYEQHTGLKPQDVIGKTLLEIMPQADRRQIEKYGRVALTGEPLTFEYYSKTFNRHIRVKAFSPERGRLAAIFEDVTARHQLEDALRASEEKFHTAVETMLDGFALMSAVRDPAGRISDFRYDYINEAGSRLNRRSQAEHLGQTMLAMQPALRDTDYIDQLACVVDTGNKLMMEALPVPMPAGDHLETYYFDARVVKYGDGFTITWHEVTQRKRMEEALRASRELLAGIIDAVPARIFWKDQRLHYLGCNQAFACDAGLSEPPDLIGKDDFELGWREQAELYRRDDQAVIESGQARLFIEEPQTRPDGHTVTLLTSKVPLRDAQGQVVGVLGTYIDITERKHLEEDLRELNATLEQRVADRTADLQAANVRLTELDRLKDEFLSRISHELRTPLAGLMIALELLEVSKPDKRERYMARLKEAGQRLQQLIEDILAFAQLSHQLDGARPDWLAINDWLEGRLAAWQKQCADRGLALQLDLADHLPAARADAELMLQILNRLMSNAVSYTPAGSITLATDLRVDDNGQRWVAVNVTDTGPGITPADLPHIFKRFYRGQAAADYKTPGAGIGLCISRDIAERLGGRLTVETEVGQGSTFSLWLPATIGH